jgi:hypothetical protein
MKDDEVGGAEPTGTYVYTNVSSFLQEQPVEMLLLQQGLETQKIFEANAYPGWYAIKEGDEFVVTAPTDFYHYGDHFRILNSRPSSHNRRDPRGYIMLTMVRSEIAHEHQ